MSRIVQTGALIILVNMTAISKTASAIQKPNSAGLHIVIISTPTREKLFSGQASHFSKDYLQARDIITPSKTLLKANACLVPFKPLPAGPAKF